MNADSEQPRIRESGQGRRALELAAEHGVLRARDARQAGVSSATLTRLVRTGALVREERGLYRLPGLELSEHHTLAEVGSRAPKAIVCLLSALQVHELTTQLAYRVWLALPRGRHVPRLGVQTEVVRVSEPALSHGVEELSVYGVSVRVTTPARTVADCFKFRSRVGHDVAIEALRDFLRTRRHELDQLYAAAAVCRVSNVMAPYLEALL
ncbi:MAG: type IV toxin-antitoxin system AbiEi family antitoxin domain-containing protein [Myxococcota bacterium]